MKITLDINKFQEIIKKGYSLDVVFMLANVEILGTLSNESTKISTLVQSLIRKGLITDNGEKLTTLGEDLLKYISIEIEENDKTNNGFVPFVKKKIVCEDFERWWKEFPSSDFFEYKNRKFEGCRGLKVKKDDCAVKFNKLISEGKYTAEEMIEALKLELQRKMEMSVKTGENKLSYMRATLSYLNQDNLSFVDEIRKGAKVNKQDDIEYGVNG